MGDGDDAWGSVEDMLREASGINVRENGAAKSRGGGGNSLVEEAADVSVSAGEASSASVATSSTSAYMLVYRRRDSGDAEGLAEARVPEPCQAMVHEENLRLAKLCRLSEIQKRVVTVRAWGCLPPERGTVGQIDEDTEVVLEVLDSLSLATLTAQIAGALCVPTAIKSSCSQATENSKEESGGSFQGASAADEAWRLRRYNRYKAVGEVSAPSLSPCMRV